MTRNAPILICLLAGESLLASSVGAAQHDQEPEPPRAPPEAATSEPEITKYPVLKRFIEAVYPPRALAERREAAVVLEIDIGETGEVTDVRITQGADAAGYGFEEAAVAAVSQFEFEPAEAAGVPIPVTITYKYGFVLRQAPPEPQDTAQHVPVVSLRGRLLERGTRLPLAGVVVTIFQGEGEAARGFEATSDGRGYFEFYDLAPGEWRVLAEPAGYYPVRTAETVTHGEVVEATYHVERRSYNSLDVLVEAQRPGKEVTRRTIRREEIEAVPGSFGDPLSVVSNMPGVARMQQLGSTSDMFKGGGVVVRGSSPEDTTVAVNGIRFPYLYHFSGVRTAIPAGMLEYLDFQPGNFSSYYGRSTGGVLDARLKRLDPDNIGGYVDVSVLDAGVYLEAPLGEDGALAVGGRRSYIDAILNGVIPDDGPVVMAAAPRYYDFQLLADYRPAPGHEVSFFGIGSDDRMEMVFSNPADADSIDVLGMGLASRFYWGILSHDWRITERARNEVKLAIGWNEDRYEFGAEKFVHRQRTNYQLVDSFSMKLTHGLVARCGLDLTAFDATYDVSFRRPRAEGEVALDDLEGDGLRRTKFAGAWYVLPAAFVEAELTLLDDLLVVPGLRVDHFPSPTEETTFDPRLTARWRVSDRVTLKGGAGVYHQPPTIEQFDESFGNPGLDAFWAYQYSAAGEYQILPHLSVDLSLFYKDIRHMIGLSSKIVERDGETVSETYNNGGRGRVYGADLLIRHELANNFFGWIAYTISRAERRDPGSNEYRLFDHDQTHVFTVLGSYRLPRNWEVGVRWRFVSGNPYTPYTGSVLDMDSDRYLPIAARANSGRLAPFHQLDLRVDKRWVFDFWMFSAYVDLQNAYGRANAEERHYNHNFSKSRDESGTMSFMPVFGLRAEF